MSILLWVVIILIVLLNAWATLLAIYEDHPWWKILLMVPFGFVFILRYFIKAIFGI